MDWMMIKLKYPVESIQRGNRSISFDNIYYIYIRWTDVSVSCSEYSEVSDKWYASRNNLHYIELNNKDFKVHLDLNKIFKWNE